MNIFYYDIAIPIPIRETFTYQSKEIIKSGSRVAVKFRNKDIVGYVVKQLFHYVTNNIFIPKFNCYS